MKGTRAAFANIVSVDEETLNALLDEEVSERVGAERYERAAGRDAYRSGHYARRLITGVGEIELNVPKLLGTAARTVRDGFAERWPARNSRRSTGAGSGRTTGLNASTARSG